jgi:hypothetical protein
VPKDCAFKQIAHTGLRSGEAIEHKKSAAFNRVEAETLRCEVSACAVGVRFAGQPRAGIRGAADEE